MDAFRHHLKCLANEYEQLETQNGALAAQVLELKKRSETRSTEGGVDYNGTELLALEDLREVAMEVYETKRALSAEAISDLDFGACAPAAETGGAEEELIELSPVPGPRAQKCIVTSRDIQGDLDQRACADAGVISSEKVDVNMGMEKEITQMTLHKGWEIHRSSHMDAEDARTFFQLISVNDVLTAQACFTIANDMGYEPLSQEVVEAIKFLNVQFPDSDSVGCDP
eukprot:TRINITY_DN27082_c0_g3_i1.p1 TRINITY_DN27082_c0_g3~~TRINITY_DN27082_c0_g3_i1.p1  ORF type:complete len:227 (+),score=64.45 TRINITY_DN27082_c0_g3_i1:163-843(+)